MSQREKLLQRITQFPKDFTYDDVRRLMSALGFTEDTGGKTSGSRVAFVDSEKNILRLHKPHPGNELKLYQVEQILTFLKNLGVVK